MDSFAFVIGVNNYDPKPDGLRNLEGAVNDSDDFVDWLKSETGGKLPEENIFHIKSSGTDIFPKIGNTTQELFNFLDRINGQKVHGKLYFYFAGHGVGHPDEIDQNHLCLSDWTKQNCFNALASVPAISFFRYLGVFEETIFIFDCCRTRYFRARLDQFITANIKYGNYADPSVFIAFSTSYDDEAHEYDQMNANGVLEKRGVFTKVLLDGLRGAAADENGDIDHDSLGTYLMKEVNSQAQKKGFSQRPQYSVTLGNGADRILFSQIPVAMTPVSFYFTDSGNYLLKDSKDKTIDTFTTATNNSTIIKQLSKGYYSIIRAADNYEVPFRMPYANNIITL